jgi:hypothetical protein
MLALTIRQEKEWYIKIINKGTKLLLSSNDIISCQETQRESTYFTRIN